MFSGRERQTDGNRLSCLDAQQEDERPTQEHNGDSDGAEEMDLSEVAETKAGVEGNEPNDDEDEEEFVSVL